MSVFHIVTNSYKEAEKYLNLGWELKLTRPVLLRGINKEITNNIESNIIAMFGEDEGKEILSIMQIEK